MLSLAHRVFSLPILLLAFAPLTLAAERAPSIVYLLADDLGRDDVGWRGSEIRTPNLDKLARTGAELEQYYVQPVCTPTRASIMTGRYPMRYGLQVGVIKPWVDYGLDTDEQMLPEALRQLGYETAITGKWHLGHARREYLPTERGFDQQYGHYNGALDYNTHQREGGHDWHRDDQANYDKGYSTTLIGDEAARIVKDRDRKKPLFLYVPFNAVHSPFQAPKSAVDKYPQFQGNRKKYAAMMELLDESVGKIVAAFEEQGELDNTLFIFSSDNGGPSPGRITDNGELRAGKGTVYEGGVRVVAFATWPGKIKAGTKINEPIHAVDWYPTLVKLAGGTAETTKPLDGLDVWPVLASGAKSPRTEIVHNITPNGGAIRVGDYKLVKKGGAGNRRRARNQQAEANTTAGAFELYNIREDISESNDLAAEQPEKVKELAARYDELAAQAAKPLSSGEGQPAGWKAPKIYGE
jgi:arylsulfatase A-like enzyme